MKTLATIPFLVGCAALLVRPVTLLADTDRERLLRLPPGYGTADYMEPEPDPDYRHASEQAHQAFRDMKYGVRIHWGLYTLLPGARESWSFLPLTDKERQQYLERIHDWNPTRFDAGAWMDFFERAGFKAFAITTKHHEGFSLWDTRTRVTRRPRYDGPDGPVIEDCDVAYSVMETPSKRDIIKELTDAARGRDLKVNLYFSHTDWYDVRFRPYGRHPIQNVSSTHIDSLVERQQRPAKLFPDPTPEERAGMMARHREQLRELLTHYGRIDMLCLDIGFGADVWPEMKATIKEIRRQHPDLMIRNRGIGHYGDYYTPERVVPGDKAATALPWMVIYPLGEHFSYEAEAGRHKGAKWVIDNLVDSVAKGGNFMVGIGPAPDGTFHPTAVAQLEEVGTWLTVNGEAIWGTVERPGPLWREGDAVRFTAAKDGAAIYAILLQRPTDPVRLATVPADSVAGVTLLGRPGPVAWNASDSALTVAFPADAAPAHAYVLKLQLRR